MDAHGRGNIPEAAYQEELYCALTFELRNLPILPEYSHNKRGRIDFFILDKKWGIEVLKSGSTSSIAEHAARFATGGKYRMWNIFNDYIILNFCSKETVRKLEIEGKNFPPYSKQFSSSLTVSELDVEVQSRILQVELDPYEYTAEFYTCDKQLLASLTLGEGRQRLEPDYEPLTEDPSILQLLRNQLTQTEQEKRQLEQEIEDLKNEMKHKPTMMWDVDSIISKKIRQIDDDREQIQDLASCRVCSTYAKNRSTTSLIQFHFISFFFFSISLSLSRSVYKQQQKIDDDNLFFLLFFLWVLMYRHQFSIAGHPVPDSLTPTPCEK